MKNLIFVFGVLFTSSVFANFSCEVDVQRVLVYANGYVNVLHSGRNNYTYICNVKGTWKEVDTVTCALWVSMLQNAQNTDKKAIFFYGLEGACATLETYGNSPAPTYIGVIG